MSEYNIIHVIITITNHKPIKLCNTPTCAYSVCHHAMTVNAFNLMLSQRGNPSRSSLWHRVEIKKNTHNNFSRLSLKAQLVGFHAAECVPSAPVGGQVAH